MAAHVPQMEQSGERGQGAIRTSSGLGPNGVNIGSMKTHQTC